MKITIYRGTREIGGILIALESESGKVLLDAGFPLTFDSNLSSSITPRLADQSISQLIESGFLPYVKGLYACDAPQFDAVIISHAHLDHYGLLKYVHPSIPVYLSEGTKAIIDLSMDFGIAEPSSHVFTTFKMGHRFRIGDFTIKPFLMDHSAFDAAAFEISDDKKTVIYSGDFREHGRKTYCLNHFIDTSKKEADCLLIEGTMLGRHNKTPVTEHELEERIVSEIKDFKGPVLFQSSSQNVDRIVTFFKVSLKLKKTFVIDLYTANVLHRLRNLNNNLLPYPSEEYPAIKVFYPRRLTQRVYERSDGTNARLFTAFHISKDTLKSEQNNIIMVARPSMQQDIESAGLRNGIFIFSLWKGYRDSEYQKRFEDYLKDSGFAIKEYHTSGHAAISDIKRVIEALRPKLVVPVHTDSPESLINIADRVVLKGDGEEFCLH